jgi:hypothetical protein
MYRFHPSVQWRGGYPDRHQIVSQITELWKRYSLQERTTFNTKVEKVYQDSNGRWIINDRSHGHFDGVIPAIGTCGAPKMAKVEGQEKFKGEIHHSSQLDGKTAEGKKVIIIGGGASAVEGLEFVTHTGAEKTAVLARSEKWIIPRNALVDVLLSFNIFGQETRFSWIPETILRMFFYRDLSDLAPPRGSAGLFTGTPMVNSDVFNLVRQGKAEWLRGDVIRFAEDGIVFNHRSQGVPKNGPGREKLVPADMVIMATGYHRPSLGFLPDEVMTPPYQPPAWYLQVFPPEHVSICANNCTYANAIGTVGNWHIGIYTRLLLVFLVDPLAKPNGYWAKKWIDMTQWIKSRSPTGAFDFFTYSELIYWFVFCVAINPFRWKWAFFVFFGLGSALPLQVVKQEDKLRNGLGMERKKAF